MCSWTSFFFLLTVSRGPANCCSRLYRTPVDLTKVHTLVLSTCFVDSRCKRPTPTWCLVRNEHFPSPRNKKINIASAPCFHNFSWLVEGTLMVSAVFVKRPHMFMVEVSDVGCCSWGDTDVAAANGACAFTRDSCDHPHLYLVLWHLNVEMPFREAYFFFQHRQLERDHVPDVHVLGEFWQYNQQLKTVLCVFVAFLCMAQNC